MGKSRNNSWESLHSSPHTDLYWQPEQRGPLMGQFKCITAPRNPSKGVPTSLVLTWPSQKILDNSQAFKAGKNLVLPVSGWALSSSAPQGVVGGVEGRTQTHLSFHGALFETNLKKPQNYFCDQQQPAVMGEMQSLGENLWEEKSWISFFGRKFLGSSSYLSDCLKATQNPEQFGCPGSPEHQEISISPDQIVQNQSSFS